MHKRQLSLYSLCSYLPEAELVLIFVRSNFDTLRNILVMFGRNEEADQ